MNFSLAIKYLSLAITSTLISANIGQTSELWPWNKKSYSISNLSKSKERGFVKLSYRIDLNSYSSVEY